MTVTRILEIQDVDVLRRPAVEGVCFSARLSLKNVLAQH